MPEPLKLLIAHENADGWLAELKRRWPGLEPHVARTADELERLADEPFDIAYSCVTDGFPRQHHGRVRRQRGLRWLQIGGSGYDHLLPFPETGLILTNAAGVLAPVLAETVLAAIMALNRGFIGAIDAQRAGLWRPWTYPALASQTLAVVGTGAIGSALARLAKAMGMTVIGVARRPEPRAPFDAIRPMADLAAVAAGCDYLSLHVALVPETRHLVDARILAAMRPSAFLLNASRGPVVDEAALLSALAQKRIAGAYLDVFETEPLAADSPLRQQGNVLITPHMSDRVADWELRLARFFMGNLERWLAGQPLVNVVET